MTGPKTAMVMGAGLGKRMRPLTTATPKPLVRVLGKPLINYVFDHLERAGIHDVVVNVHYLADALEAHLKSLNARFDIRISDERAQLMETGGGLVKAAPLIDDDTFFCINSDNIWMDGPINSMTALANRWDDARMDALLLLVPHTRAFNHSGSGDFHLSAGGRVSRRKPLHVAPFIFTGIQIVSKRLIEDAPEEPFSTNQLWDRAIKQNRLFGLVHDGIWFDVGTPDAIAPTEAMLLNG